MTDLIGKSIGRYQVLEQLGQGGMATVYKAYDTRLEREVAIKMIRREAFPPEHLERILKRFEREAKALARLSHPNIVKVHDFGDHAGAPFLVMELLTGGTLKQLLSERSMPYQQAAALLLPIARALAYAHGEGILHRDVKPSNILITRSGDPMLTDFGIAKLLEAAEMQTLTGTGMGVGTSEYMAPEQGLGKEVDARADVYALGIVLYEMVTGQRPYTADTPLAVLYKQMNDPLPRPRNIIKTLPEEAERVLFKALAKQPEDRYPDMGAFAKALEKLAQGAKPVPAAEPGKSLDTTDFKVEAARKKGHWWPWLAGLFILAAAAVGLLLGGGKIPSLVKSITAPGLETTETRVRAKDRMVEVFIPVGSFEMGSDQGEEDEIPAHVVNLHGYWMDEHEVTNAMYAAFLNDKGNQNEGGSSWLDVGDRNNSHIQQSGGSWIPDIAYEDHPVIEVSWYGARSYCQWAGGRLPTEAEWEKAARGGLEGKLYPWGDESPSCSARQNNAAQYEECISTGTQEVKYFAPNDYGLYDVAGNAWEWVADWYEESYYSSQTKWNNPVGPENSTRRKVIRGGSSVNQADLLRVSNRDWFYPDQSLNYGFRCVGLP